MPEQKEERKRRGNTPLLDRIRGRVKGSASPDPHYPYPYPYGAPYGYPEPYYYTVPFPRLQEGLPLPRIMKSTLFMRYEVPKGPEPFYTAWYSHKGEGSHIKGQHFFGGPHGGWHPFHGPIIGSLYYRPKFISPRPYLHRALVYPFQYYPSHEQRGSRGVGGRKITIAGFTLEVPESVERILRTRGSDGNPLTRPQMIEAISKSTWAQGWGRGMCDLTLPPDVTVKERDACIKRMSRIVAERVV